MPQQHQRKLRFLHMTTPRWFSPLSARILAIMLLPILLLVIGLFSVDQYRRVLINAELDALERQGRTLARSLALEEADNAPFASRQLSPATLRHLLPLVGYGSVLRARIFAPDGNLIADTARDQLTAAQVRVWRQRGQGRFSMHGMRGHVTGYVERLSNLFSDHNDLPRINDMRLRRASDMPIVLAALKGAERRTVWRNRRGHMVLAVALPIQDLRIVRGSLLLTTSGGRIENEIAQVQWAFLQLFAGVLVITIILGLYLSRSITRPIVQLAHAARQLRQHADPSKPLAHLPDRNDEIGALSQDLRDMTDDLQQRIQATARFAADVAHELKNPLTSLRSAVETVSRLDDPAQQRRLMEVILADVSRLDRLISDISQASRVDAELASPATDIEDFEQLVSNWVSMVRSRKEDQDIILTVNKPQTSKDPAIPEMRVAMHVSRIVQILDNLLNNALSFNPEGMPIELNLYSQKRDLIFELRDFGPGLPVGKQEMIFNRFYSERPKTEAFGEHSGLGLSIARQIARAHGGELSARNHPEGGAVFTLRLPLAR